MPFRGEQFETEHDGERSAQEEEECNGDEIQQGDALVVNRQQPGLDAEMCGDVVFAGFNWSFGNHRLASFRPAGFPVDLMYSINCKSWSSVTSPWNVGMMG